MADPFELVSTLSLLPNRGHAAARAQSPGEDSTGPESRSTEAAQVMPRRGPARAWRLEAHAQAMRRINARGPGAAAQGSYEQPMRRIRASDPDRAMFSPMFTRCALTPLSADERVRGRDFHR